jgi:uncharacterized protein (UPF0297 family)
MRTCIDFVNGIELIKLLKGRDNMSDLGSTQIIRPMQEYDLDVTEVLARVYEALTEKGYNPINQIVGYILSEDPTYITTYNNARSLIRHIDRDELLQVLVRSYLKH